LGSDAAHTSVSNCRVDFDTAVTLREPVNIARVAIFAEPPVLQDDDERRARALRELLQSLPGFITGYELREEATGRLMSVTLWDSEAALEAGERAVRERPVSDQRGIRRPLGSSAGWSTRASGRYLGRVATWTSQPRSMRQPTTVRGR
jgi:heme-degrading monooxygenase HmoA